MTEKLANRLSTDAPRVLIENQGATRAFDMTLDIAASPEEVWRALTDAEELVRWFPLQAAVTPGAGGVVSWSWNGKWDWKHRIDAWEPGKRLRLVQRSDVGYDVEGRPPADSGPLNPEQVVLEFTLETHEGRTRLRMVHSGFGFGGTWDDEFDGISTGWQYELRALRFYLERHRGSARVYGAATHTSSLPIEGAWARLVAADAFPFTTPSTPGGLCTLDAATGDRFSGPLFAHIPGREFSVIAPDLHDGLARLVVHRAKGRTGLMVVFVSYAPEDGARVEGLTARASALLQRIFTA